MFNFCDRMKFKMERKLTDRDLMTRDERVLDGKEWVARDLDKKTRAQAKIEPWDGAFPVPELGHHVRTPHGPGQVVKRFFKLDGDLGYRTSVKVRSFHDKKIVEVFGRDCAAMTADEAQEEKKAMSKNKGKKPAAIASGDMTEKLKEAGKLAENEAKAKRERTVRGSHLLEPMLAKVKAAGGLTAVEKSGFYKVTADGVKGKAAYLARKGGRVDLSNFTVQSEAVTQISEEDARAKHLGKVRGQIDFGKGDDVVLRAFDAALKELKVAPPETPKPEKKAKAPKPATEATTETAPTAAA